MHEFTCVGTTVDRLGESPVWSQRDEALYWVDIRNPQIRRYDALTGRIDSWTMPSLVGSIGLCTDGRLVVALQTSIALFDPRTGELGQVADPGFDDPAWRFNDGRVDRQGRFWVGSMNDTTREPVGSLFRITREMKPVAVLGGIRCPNSLCWSPDSRTMYFADSDLRTIFAYEFDPGTGQVGSRRPLVTIDGPAVPDGCVVDAQGYLWCALYGGARIVRYAPDGRVDREIGTPVSQPTSCAFGDADRHTLYVTSAAQRLTREQLHDQPLAGRLLRIRLDVAGIEEPLFQALPA